jgi:tetratricopeptide (TPR) repeat protein
MVRNEADIIEPWARYNLRVLDCLHVIDHGSDDNTVEILQCLQAEGLPVVLHHWADPGYTQVEAMRSVARPLAESGTVDFVVPLDADELLATDRASLHQTLAALPQGHVGVMRWRTYLPEGEGEGPFFFRHMEHYRSLELDVLHKVIAPAELLSHCSWTMGNHGFVSDDDGLSMPRAGKPLVLAHYPVRNAHQLRCKVMLGSHASRLKAKRTPLESWHWLLLERELAQADSLKQPIDLQRIALGYSFSNQPEVISRQEVWTGPIDPAPNLMVRFVAKPLGQDEIRARMESSRKQHAEFLSTLGHTEFNVGNQAWRQGNFVRALEHYTEASLLNPGLSVAHLGRARCLVQLDDWVQAREAFAQTLRLDSTNYSAWLEAGHLCRQQGELEQAALSYQRAITLHPQRYEAPLGLARVLEQIGRDTEAADAYEHAQRVAFGTGSQDAAAWRRLRQVHHHMGKYRLERGDLVRAGQALQAALIAAQNEGSNTDDLAEIQMDLGELLLRVGKREEAERLLTLASGASAETTLARLGATSFKYNLWQDAIAVLRKNVQLHPHSIQARWNLAHLLAECWQMREAEQALLEAEALGPVPGATSLRASVAGHQGDADTALTCTGNWHRKSRNLPQVPP